MKFLISLACLAIIAATGLLFYRDHQTFGAFDRISIARAEADAENEAFDVSIREKCKAAFAGNIGNDTEQMRSWCRENGKISYEDQNKGIALE